MQVCTHMQCLCVSVSAYNRTFQENKYQRYSGKKMVFRKENKASPQPFMTGHGTGKRQEAELMLSLLSLKATLG